MKQTALRYAGPLLGTGLGIGLWLGGGLGSAAAQDAGAPLPGADAPLSPLGAASGVGEGASSGACVEHLPPGRARPAVSETFPTQLRAGYGGVLRLTIEHGKGETVLPSGMDLRLSTPEGRALNRSGFVLANTDGPHAPRIERTESADHATTSVELTFVPLPEEPGPQSMTLPSVPIAISRASGDLTTLCTRPHTVEVQDPTSNIVQAQPQPNPEPVRQLEVWTLAKTLALGALIALPIGALVALLVAYWLRRPRPVPPPPPPRPPWESALEALARLRRQGLLEKGETREHFALVSLAVREYLGRRYGFDGLESTTREMLSHLAVARPGTDIEREIRDFLERADLVKFANLRPEVAECESALAQGERIVRQTMVRGEGQDSELNQELQSAVERSEAQVGTTDKPAGGAA